MSNFVKAAITLIIALSSAPVFAQPSADSTRLDAVAERGRHVMPFNLERTLHVFEKTKHGGLQQVVAKNASDHQQIGLIRDHLLDLVKLFRQGDFSRQRRIHGNDMPGIAELADSYKRVQFVYRELPSGAEIEYVAEESALVDAIHRYFNAQLRDHARHAIGSKPMKCEHKTHKHHKKHRHQKRMSQPADNKE